MAPSSEQIKNLFESHIDSQVTALKQGQDIGGLVQVGDLINHFSDDIDFQIVGHDFPLACQLKGIQAVKEHLSQSSQKTSVSDIIHQDKPIHGEVVQVIGGGPSEWAAVVLKSVATNREGKPFNHEWVVTMRFNNNDKISVMKTYPDTGHVQDHIPNAT